MATPEDDKEPQVARSRLRWLVLLVLVLALVPRGIFLVQLARHSPTFDAPEGGDSIFYDRVARGSPTPPRAYFHSPLYRWFVSGSYALFGRDLLLLRLLQAALGALGAVLALFLTRRLFGSDLLATLAGALYAICGPLLFYEGQLLPAGILPALTLASALALEGYARRRSVPAAALLGLCIAGLALVRPTALLWVFAILWWAWRRGGLRLRVEGALIGVLLLGILPVTLRNYLVEHDTVLITANAGLNLYIGNNAHARGTYNLPAGLWFRPGDPLDDFAGRRAAALELGHAPSSSEVSNWWARRALAWMSAHPGRTVALWARKVLLWLNHSEHPQLYDYRGYAAVASVLRVLPGAGLLLAPGILGLFVLLLTPRVAPALRLYLGCTLLLALAFLPFFVVGRYRAPFLALLAPLAAWALARVAVALREGWRSALPWTLGLVGAIALVALPLGRPVAAPQYLAFGRAAQTQGRSGEALSWYARAVAAAPLHWAGRVASQRQARLLLERGQLAAAAQVLQQARQRHPASASLLCLSASLHRRRGELRQADVLLRDALASAPGEGATWVELAELSLARGQQAAAREALRSARLLARGRKTLLARIAVLERRLAAAGRRSPSSRGTKTPKGMGLP